MKIMKRWLIAISLVSLPLYAEDNPIPEIDVEESPGNTQNGDLNTSNSNNGNISKTYNGAGSRSMPANTAVAPSLMSSGSESCLQSVSNGVQLVGFGVSRGLYRQDEECNRRRNAITLANMGLKIAGVSLMCQNPDVWRAMLMAATPCPIIKYGKIVVGKRALLEIKQRPELYIADFEERREFYSAILGVGVEENGEEESNTGSLSSRFRTSASDGD